MKIKINVEVHEDEPMSGDPNPLAFLWVLASALRAMGFQVKTKEHLPKNECSYLAAQNLAADMSAVELGWSLVKKPEGKQPTTFAEVMKQVAPAQLGAMGDETNDETFYRNRMLAGDFEVHKSVVDNTYRLVVAQHPLPMKINEFPFYIWGVVVYYDHKAKMYRAKEDVPLKPEYHNLEKELSEVVRNSLLDGHFHCVNYVGGSVSIDIMGVPILQGIELPTKIEDIYLWESYPGMYTTGVHYQSSYLLKPQKRHLLMVDSKGVPEWVTVPANHLK
jgi:hypothetical protein